MFGSVSALVKLLCSLSGTCVIVMCGSIKTRVRSPNVRTPITSLLYFKFHLKRSFQEVSGYAFLWDIGLL